MKRLFLLSSLCLAVHLFAYTAELSLLHRADTESGRRWVDSVYNTLSPRDKIAQLFVPIVNPGSGEASRNSIKQLVGGNHVGGLLFNSGTIAQFADLTSYAQSLSQVPLMMTLDGEWGLSMRVKDTPRFPHNMGLGAIANERLLYDYGREVARECRLMGISVNFAPVLDVNSNPDNPVIGYRSFGENPSKVASLGIAYAKGLQSGGVMAVGKHFPGHGDTSTDSHKTLPTVNHDRKHLETTDLLPFKRYIDEGLDGIMVGHLNVPAIDSSGTPASLSHKITTGLLKERMGFNGLLFTDALAMKGAVSNQNKCVAALLAGADVLLGSGQPASDIKAVEKAIRDKLLSQKIIDDRCRKMLAYKYALGLSSPSTITRQGLDRAINSPRADAVNRRLAAASMTVVRNEANLLPIVDLTGKSIAVVSLGAAADNTFSRYCAKYAGVDNFASDGTPFSAGIVSQIKNHDIVIVGIFNDHASTRQLLAQLHSAKNLIPVFFVNPYKMAKFSASLQYAKTLLIAYDDTPYTREYAAQAIFGGVNVTGRLPVNLKGIAPMGTGVKLSKTRLGYTSPVMEGFQEWLTDSIDSLAHAGVRAKAFPGCQILVAKGGNVIIDKCYGTLDYLHRTPVTDETIYDLASVSKAAGTLPGVMAAYDDKLFSLDDCASKHVPGLKNGDKEGITVKQLLYHESGMPASLNMFQTMMDTASYSGQLITARKTTSNPIKIDNKAYGNASARLRRDITSPHHSAATPIEAANGIFVGKAAYDTIMNRIYNAQLRPGNKYNYSCLNFALLTDMEQRLTGMGHDSWVAQRIFAPLGMSRTTYRPLDNGFSTSEVAPTEHDTFLRRQTLRGYVHDELANMSGGVQGNAGLFSTADDIAKLCQMWLNGGIYGGIRVMSEPTVKLFTTSKSPTCRRGLGFDKPDIDDPQSSPTTELASPSTFGHLGFTGTCFWVDPENDLIFVFLTNRVNPTRDNAAFSRLNIRPRLFEQVYRALPSK